MSKNSGYGRPPKTLNELTAEMLAQQQQPLGGAAAAAYYPPAMSAPTAAMGGKSLLNKVKDQIAEWTGAENAENKAKANAAAAAAKAAANAAAYKANVELRGLANPYGAAGVRYANAVAAAAPGYRGQGQQGLNALLAGARPQAAAAPGGGGGAIVAPVFGPAPGGGGVNPGINPALRAAAISGVPGLGERRGGRRRSRKSRKASRKNRRNRSRK